MEYLAGTSQALAGHLMSSLARYRHRVFVEKLGWNLACQGGLEFDQFDRPDTIYMAARREDGAIAGVARLLPTDRPYLLGEVFPQLMGNQPLPRTPHVWELSRFAAVDFESATATGAMGQFSSPVTLSLLREVLALAQANGVHRLITVSPLGVERLLRRTGVIAHRAAPPMVVNGHPIFACWIEVPGARND